MKLKWSDFKKTIEPHSREVAYTCGGIACDQKQENTNTMHLNIYAYFDEEMSAKSKETKYLTELILRHEQGHFDIWEWYARIARKKISDTNLSKLYQISTIYHNIYKKAVEMQNKYDQETQNGIDSVAQAKWDTLIHQNITEYATYSNPELQVSTIKGR